MTSHDSEPASARPLTGPEVDAVRADFPYLKRPRAMGSRWPTSLGRHVPEALLRDDQGG